MLGVCTDEAISVWQAALSGLRFASVECICILHCQGKENLPYCKSLPHTEMPLQTSEYVSSSNEGNTLWKCCVGPRKAKLKGLWYSQFLGCSLENLSVYFQDFLQYPLPFDFIKLHMEKEWQIFMAVRIQIIFWKNCY